MTRNYSRSHGKMNVCGIVNLVDGATPNVLWSSFPLTRWDLLSLLPWGNWIGGSTRYVRLPKKGKLISFWYRTKTHGLGIIAEATTVPIQFSQLALEIFDELGWWSETLSGVDANQSNDDIDSAYWEDLLQDFQEVIQSHLEHEDGMETLVRSREVLSLFPPLSWGTILFLLLISGNSRLNFQVFLNGKHEKILSIIELLFLFLPNDFILNALSFVSMSGSLSYFNQNFASFSFEDPDPNTFTETLALIGVERLPSNENLSYLQAMALSLEQGKIQPGILIDHPLIRHAEYLMKTEPLALKHWLTHEVLPLGERALYNDIFARYLGDTMIQW